MPINERATGRANDERSARARSTCWTFLLRSEHSRRGLGVRQHARRPSLYALPATTPGFQEVVWRSSVQTGVRLLLSPNQQPSNHREYKNEVELLWRTVLRLQPDVANNQPTAQYRPQHFHNLLTAASVRRTPGISGGGTQL